ncbi:MAG TPA: tetratricopeptide repeat protein, partial [Pyrinomonadaceae bacterium]|nr:tetratricopeptide repeat protein [Pyrinomonadaceae bacterium]
MKNSILFGIGGLVIGLITGFTVANSINRNAVNQTAQTVANPQIPNQSTADIKPQQQGAMIPQIAEILDKAEKEPNNFDAQIKAAEMHAQIQRFDKAAEYYERASKAKPDDYDTIVKTANAYFDAKNYETAEKWYLTAIQKNPDDINVRTDLGITFIERQTPDLDRAVKEFQTSLEKNPKHEPTLYNLGIAYFKKGNTEELQKVVQKLDEINPNSELVKRLK